MLVQTYKARLKTRAQIERDIPRVDHGWWRDVCPGRTLTLRDATQADLDRCYVQEERRQSPQDYLCEAFDGGCLVLRAAVAKLTPIPAGAMS